MIPVLNRPAYPHWMFTPRAMMAETSAKFRMNSAWFHEISSPVARYSTATPRKSFAFFDIRRISP